MFNGTLEGWLICLLVYFIPKLPSHADGSLLLQPNLPVSLSKGLAVSATSALNQVDAPLRLHEHYLLGGISVIRDECCSKENRWLQFSIHVSIGK